MKKISRTLSIILCIVMLIPNFMALAADTTQFTLTTSEKCYIGITYDVVATIDNLPTSKVVGDENTVSAFTFSANIKNDDGSLGEALTIQSTNSYKIVDNGDNTSKVSETAKIQIDNNTAYLGKTILLSASYNGYDTTSETGKLAQPITSISVSDTQSSNEYTDYYYDATQSKLYLNNYNYTNNKKREGKAKLTFSYQPSDADDKIALGSNDANILFASADNTNYEIYFKSENAAANSTISLSPQSGFGTKKTISLYECTALTKFSLSLNGMKFDSDASISVIGGEAFTLKPTDVSPSNYNDVFEYKLYSDYENDILAPSNYLSPNGDGSCDFNISNPGTYRLICAAKPYGYKEDGTGNRLQRDLALQVSITVNEPNLIENVSMDVSDIVLYTSTKKTFDVSSHVTVQPEDRTNSVKYAIADTSIATVSDAGVITAKTNGVTTLYVYSDKDSNISTSCTVTVKKEITAINSISTKDGSDLTLPTGHAVQLVANTTPAQNDETIRWSSQNTDALTITSGGYAVANKDYVFGSNSSVNVMVTATSENGIQATQFIKVVPAIESKSIEIAASDDTLNSDSFVVSKDNYKVFKGNSFTISAKGYDASGNISNDVYTWMVSYNGNSQVDISDCSYITSTYNKVADSYTIKTSASGTFEFYCYAIKRGGSISNDNVYSKATFQVCEKATALSFINPDTLASYTSTNLAAGTKASVNVGVNMSPVSAYDEDPVTFTTSDKDIADVVWTSKSTATITVGDVQGVAKITAKTLSGNKVATFTVYSNNNINFVTVYNGNDVFMNGTAFEYNGSKADITPKVIYNGVQLTTTYYSINYTGTTAKGASYNSTTVPTEAGSYELNVVGKSEYSGSTKKIDFVINPRVISDKCTLTVNSTYYAVITEKDPTPIISKDKFTLKDVSRDKTLTNGTDFTYICENNDKYGQATLKVVGTGNYQGELSATYNVCDDVNKLSVDSIPDQVYTGNDITPKLTVRYNGSVLTEGVHYKVSYSYNKNVGEATAKVTGITPYFTDKTISKVFYIIPQKVSGATQKSRTSSSITLSWTQGTNVSGYQIYDVTSKKVVKTITDASVISSTIGSLTAQKAYTYKIRAYKQLSDRRIYGSWSNNIYAYTCPKTPSLTLSTKSKTIKGTWKKVASVSGYQIQISTKSSCSGAKTISLSPSKLTYTFKSLKKGKKYYVRIRSYKKISVNGKSVTTYSNWSKKAIVCK